MKPEGGTSGAGTAAPAEAISLRRDVAAAGPDEDEPGRRKPKQGWPAAHGGRAGSRARAGRKPHRRRRDPGLHVARALFFFGAIASGSSLGSAATMEQAWLSADSYEVTSREGNPGQASVEMFFSGLQANLKAMATGAAADVAKVEEASKAVMDRRTTLYNRAVTHYHKAKPDLARELETAKVEAAKVPRLESDLLAARAQCAESEEAGRSSAAKLKLAEQELTRLRLLEQNHLSELNSLRTAEKEKVDDLSRRLTEVEKQRLALQEEVTAKSTELTATAKRWTDEIGALDRGLAGECTLMFPSLAAGSRNF
ncbi:hypothetical protein QYE76_000737 [Lolium multiflorum]|uniref:Uncharacterized protein n=1 Tax=Lolium multiflorum TaxID=4521 RepID=A0AAD8RKQ1_LOLMU|nr:hypothetical protein QYE76_000737 [Lolium multiflorum]